MGSVQLAFLRTFTLVRSGLQKLAITVQALAPCRVSSRPCMMRLQLLDLSCSFRPLAAEFCSSHQP